MNTRKLGFVVVLLLALLLMMVVVAQAGAGEEAMVTGIYSALNEGDIETALALFDEKAVAVDEPCHRNFEGQDGIREMLDLWEYNGRTFEIISIESDGELVKATIDIANSGVVWAEQEIEVLIEDGEIQSHTVTGFDMLFYRLR